MIHKLLSHFHHWELALLAFLKPLGFWGVGILGAIDAGSVAIPMDVVIAGYVWGNHSHFWIYPIVGAAGAAIGALVPFYIGRAGGELVLTKRGVDPKKYERMRARFDRHRWFAVMVPAAMPPPFPFKLFAFGAGIFEMRVGPYVGSVFVGRAAHYMVTAVLVIFFGPQIMDLFSHGMRRHRILIEIAAAAITAGILVYLFYRRRRTRRRASELTPPN